MAFDLNEIRAELVHGGWRPNHFRVIITNPFESISDLKTPFMVRAAQLPAFNMGRATMYYFGRQTHYPGDRTFEDWQTTVVNDEDFVVRNALELWSGKMNAIKGNISSTNVASELKSTGEITAFGKDGRELRTYRLDGLWPSNIAAIDADWSTTDTIAEFQVTWSFDDAYPISGITGLGPDI